MSARIAKRCPVCGLRSVNNADNWRTWCADCVLLYVEASPFAPDAAEWGAKRRAAASKKAGGK